MVQTFTSSPNVSEARSSSHAGQAKLAYRTVSSCEAQVGVARNTSVRAHNLHFLERYLKESSQCREVSVLPNSCDRSPRTLQMMMFPSYLPEHQGTPPTASVQTLASTVLACNPSNAQLHVTTPYAIEGSNFLNDSTHSADHVHFFPFRFFAPPPPPPPPLSPPPCP